MLLGPFGHLFPRCVEYRVSCSLCLKKMLLHLDVGKD